MKRRRIGLALLFVALLVVTTAFAQNSANDALFAAAQNGTADDVRAAIKAGANVNTRDEYGQTALMAAASLNTDAIKPLIEAGVDVNARDVGGSTVLMCSAINNTNPEAIKILVAAGADVNARDGGGVTALLYAAFSNTNPDVVKALIAAGANVNARDDDGYGALDYFQIRPKKTRSTAQMLTGRCVTCCTSFPVAWLFAQNHIAQGV